MFTFRANSVVRATCATCWLTLCGVAQAYLTAPSIPDDPKEPTQKPVLRRPVALVLAHNGKRLFVANQRAGSISVVDLQTQHIDQEYVVGKKLVDLAVTADDSRLLAIDESANELIVLDLEGSRLTSRHRLQISPTPVSVQLSPDGSSCTVASLWPRRLTIIGLGKTPHIDSTIELPFAPRCQLFVAKDKLLMAEAFGGRLALVNLTTKQIETVRSIPGHNIRGLALSADKSRLLLTEQMLNRLGRGQFDDIHWGNLITNNVRSLRLASALDPKADLLTGSDLIHLGDAGHGAGDPAGVIDCAGKMAVTLAGVDEVALGSQSGGGWRYVAVGRGPTAIVPDQAKKRVYVANTFSDSISVIDLGQQELLAEISLGPTAEPGAADRGEALFHNARLSHDGWLSCQSCHTDGHSSGKLADTLGDGTYGTPKRILSLLGVGATGPWAWNGSVTKLEDQVAKSITSTMQGGPPKPGQVEDLTAYLKTLPAAPPRRSGAGHEAAARGKAIFAKENCARCHAPPLYTSAESYDVGLADEAGNRRYNPPSLRGVSQGGPYFHDGRAATLAEVFTRFHHQLKADLSKQDIADLLAFLDTV